MEHIRNEADQVILYFFPVCLVKRTMKIIPIWTFMRANPRNNNMLDFKHGRGNKEVEDIKWVKLTPRFPITPQTEAMV